VPLLGADASFAGDETRGLEDEYKVFKASI
jgi:hypothetical protein